MGEASYPHCTSKVSVPLLFAEHLAHPVDAAALPNWLSEFLQRPPLGSAWLPTVHANAVEMMLVDEVGEDKFFRLARKGNEDYLRSPLYRAAVRVFSPAMLVRGGSLRWGHFHRGAPLETEQLTPTRARLRLNYPDHLFPPIIAREKALSFQVATELAGAEHVACEVKESDASHTVYELSWR